LYKGSEDLAMEKTKKGNIPSKALMMGAALVTLNGLTAEEAKAATANGPMSAIVLTPITFSATSTLHFGSFTVGTAADTVTIEPGGGRTAGGAANGVTLVAGGALENDGQFTINSGAAGTLDIQVSIGAGPFTVSNGAVTMGVASFDLDSVAAGDQNTLTITNAANTITVNVGAVLSVNGSQATGTYTGNYTINANYQ